VRRAQGEGKPPITYVPFDINDPATGQPYKDTDVLTIDGKQVPYPQVKSQVNAIEQQFNAHGYSCTTPRPK